MPDRPEVPALRRMASELLDAMADHDGPVSLAELLSSGRPADAQTRLQLSVARVAGLVRAVPGETERYAPTALGFVIAGRSRAFAAAQDERTSSDTALAA